MQSYCKALVIVLIKKELRVCFLLESNILPKISLLETQITIKFPLENSAILGELPEVAKVKGIFIVPFGYNILPLPKEFTNVNVPSLEDAKSHSEQVPTVISEPIFDPFNEYNC